MVTWVGLIGALAQCHGKVIWKSQQERQSIYKNGWKLIVFAAFATIMFTSDVCDGWSPPKPPGLYQDTPSSHGIKEVKYG